MIAPPPVSGNSRRPQSAQTGLHPGLGRAVQRHRDRPFQRPFLPASTAAWADFQAWLERQEAEGGPRPLILDAGCGVGESTLRLAARFPEARVIGVDKSAARLGRQLRDNGRAALAAQASAPGAGAALGAALGAAGGALAGDLRAAPSWAVFRADLEDWWRLWAAWGRPLWRQYVLYPNPWPKPGDLGRRWYGHPVWPVLTRLGGRLELRTNWEPYALDWAQALSLLGHPAVPVKALPVPGPESALTPFERKYAASGHALWQVVSHG